VCSTDTNSTTILRAALALAQEMGIDKSDQAERKNSCEQQADMETSAKRQSEMCL